jgi:hypothetical protein
MEKLDIGKFRSWDNRIYKNENSDIETQNYKVLKIGTKSRVIQINKQARCQQNYGFCKK